MAGGSNTSQRKTIDGLVAGLRERETATLYLPGFPLTETLKARLRDDFHFFHNTVVVNGTTYIKFKQAVIGAPPRFAKAVPITHPTVQRWEEEARKQCEKDISIRAANDALVREGFLADGGKFLTKEEVDALSEHCSRVWDKVLKCWQLRDGDDKIVGYADPQTDEEIERTSAYS
jgi:hypothetical protein